MNFSSKRAANRAALSAAAAAALAELIAAARARTEPIRYGATGDLPPLR